MGCLQGNDAFGGRAHFDRQHRSAQRIPFLHNGMGGCIDPDPVRIFFGKADLRRCKAGTAFFLKPTAIAEFHIASSATFEFPTVYSQSSGSDTEIIPPFFYKNQRIFLPPVGVSYNYEDKTPQIFRVFQEQPGHPAGVSFMRRGSCPDPGLLLRPFRRRTDVRRASVAHGADSAARPFHSLRPDDLRLYDQRLRLIRERMHVSLRIRHEQRHEPALLSGHFRLSGQSCGKQRFDFLRPYLYGQSRHSRQYLYHLRFRPFRT